MADVLTTKVWPNGTEVTLYDVPWDSSYKDVVAWENVQSRDEWFASHRGLTFPTKFHWLRPNVPIVVECPYSTAYRFNYLSVRNPANPVISEGPERTLYYFVTDCRPSNTGTCTLEVQLDVATTYGPSIEFGNTFVEGGHLPQTLVNPSTFTAEELRRYCVQPEGLDIGRFWRSVNLTGNQTVVKAGLKQLGFWRSVNLTGNQTKGNLFCDLSMFWRSVNLTGNQTSTTSA